MEMIYLALELTIVSVPLSGLTSVNVMFRSIIDIGGAYRFRPLIGVNFCKRPLHTSGWSGGQKVSVPLSGLTSVNN